MNAKSIIILTEDNKLMACGDQISTQNENESQWLKIDEKAEESGKMRILAHYDNL